MSSPKFWGEEIKPNESLKVTVEDSKLLHITHVALGEVENGGKVTNVPAYANINGKEMLVGVLSWDKPQVVFDLVLFEQVFKLSHGWKDGSLYFLGYFTDKPAEHQFSEDDYDEDNEEEKEESEV